MEIFDLDQHYKQAREATTPEQVAQLRQEFDQYSTSLTEEEHALFRKQLEEHARVENVRTRALIDFVNEIMGLQPQPAEPTSVNNIA